MTVRAVLSLGANLGDRLFALQSAVSALGLAGSVVAVSPVYETAPVGGVEQPDFLNAVVLLDTSLPPEELLALGQSVESGASRVRAERWGPRTLDVDLIAYGSLVSSDPVLTLPHPRAYERAFVLAPWLDVDPAASLPGLGPVRDLLAAADGDVRRRDDLVLAVPA